MSAEPPRGTNPHGDMKVQKQIQLPFTKAWEITIRSIKIRLGRSLITASGIVLGIAFFSSVNSTTLFAPVGNPHDREVIAAAKTKPGNV